MNFFKNKNKVTSILKKYAFIRSFKVLSDNKFEYKGKEIEIDNILIGFFGIIVVTDLDYKGEIYVENEKSTEWLNINNSQKIKFPSPLINSIEQVNAIKTILREEKILNVKFDNLIVINDNRVDLYKPNKSPIILLEDLSKLLHQPKYDKDNECDVEKITQALMKYSKNSTVD